MSSSVFSLLLCLSLGLASPLLAQTPNTLESLVTEAYFLMRDADDLLEAGQQNKALITYREAQGRYLEVRQRDPEFKAKVVAYRLDLLEEKLATLTPEPTARPAALDYNDLQDIPEEPEDYKQLYLEARKKLAEEAARLARLEARMIEADDQVRYSRGRLSAKTAELQTLREDLTRLKTESGTQLEALEIEARDFARFNELLKERADSVEAANLDLKREIAALAQKLTTTETNLQDLQTTHEQTQQALSVEKRNATQGEQRLVLERNQLQDDLTEAQRQIEQTKSHIETLSAQTKEIPLLEETVIGLNTQNETLKSEREALHVEHSTATNQLATATARVAELSQKLEPISGELSAARSRIQELEAANKDYGKTDKDLRKRLADGQQEFTSEQQQRHQAQARLKAREKKLRELQSELKQVLSERKDALAAEDKAEKRNASLTGKLTKAEELHTEQVDRIKTLEKANQKLERQWADLDKSHSQAKTLIHELEQDLNRATAEVEVGRAQAKTLSKLESSHADLKERLTLLTKERDRLQLTLRQEKENRKQLKKTVDQQLAAITDRMNEIITLRASLDQAQKELAQLKAE